MVKSECKFCDSHYLILSFFWTLDGQHLILTFFFQKLGALFCVHLVYVVY